MPIFPLSPASTATGSVAPSLFEYRMVARQSEYFVQQQSRRLHSSPRVVNDNPTIFAEAGIDHFVSERRKWTWKQDISWSPIAWKLRSAGYPIKRGCIEINLGRALEHKKMPAKLAQYILEYPIDLNPV